MSFREYLINFPQDYSSLFNKYPYINVETLPVQAISGKKLRHVLNIESNCYIFRNVWLHYIEWFLNECQKESKQEFVNR